MRYLITASFFLSGLQLFRVEVLFNERKHFVLRRNSDFQALHRKVRTQHVWRHRFYSWNHLSTATNLWLYHTTRWRRLDKEEWEMVNREFTWTLRCCCCCRTFKHGVIPDVSVYLLPVPSIRADLTFFVTFSSGRSSRHQISPAKGAPTWGPNLWSRGDRSWRTTCRYDDMEIDPICKFNIPLRWHICLLVPGRKVNMFKGVPLPEERFTLIKRAAWINSHKINKSSNPGGYWKWPLMPLRLSTISRHVMPKESEKRILNLMIIKLKPLSGQKKGLILNLWSRKF